GRAVDEVGGDREACAAGERRGIRVTGEHIDGAAVSDGDVHRAVAGVEERAVEGRRDTEGPERRRDVRVPCAAAAVPPHLEAGERARAAAGLEGKAGGAGAGAGGAVRPRGRAGPAPPRSPATRSPAA